ncbi:hypothetical protein [Maledivibacter halophilus]|uniref:Uncharacterized protein n=1 Tax=Maledivibacter halophilus TaxID=36842 RepID=A0A1T5KX89_9FIRM|nr:hypothetical protein [Maledivibacter halophilus]SKC68432.1 hypothetical protein SAMN02194393_02147 [Maledivibacter halophilus]SKC71654.1 hypothetical protein SAMN02194393_02505 [Maledivibacter halophilus]SKC80214.1 hypothetical protein SAMN02194393_03458 [Maledivibacter halophilus]
MIEQEKQIADKNKAIRGYIIRSLVKGHHNRLLCRQLVNLMMRDAIIISPDISGYLDYLHEKKYIEYTDEKITSYTAYMNDAMIKLTSKGVDLVEGTTNDPGVDI